MSEFAFFFSLKVFLVVPASRGCFLWGQTAATWNIVCCLIPRFSSVALLHAFHSEQMLDNMLSELVLFWHTLALRLNCFLLLECCSLSQCLSFQLSSSKEKRKKERKNAGHFLYAIFPVSALLTTIIILGQFFSHGWHYWASWVLWDLWQATLWQMGLPLP